MNDLTTTNPFGAVAPRPTAGALQQQSSAVAEVQTRYLMAERFPRDEARASELIIRQFDRLGLAEKAEYQYKRGDEVIRGPSIRAAEAIAQKWGNIDFGFREVSRDTGADGITFSEVLAFAEDVQNRTRRALSFIVRHWRDTKSGGYKLKSERDVYELMSNQAQRRVRACILALVPGDIIEAAIANAAKTLSTQVDASPVAVRKMLEAFAPMGVKTEHIEAMLQRKVTTEAGIEPAQMARLKRLYAAIRDGNTTAAEAFDLEDVDAPPAGPTPGEKIEAAKRGETVPTSKAPPPPAQAPTPEPSGPGMTYAQAAEKIKAATGADVAEFVVDACLDEDMPAAQIADLRKLIETHFKAKK